MQAVTRRFFARPTLEVARDLLGRTLQVRAGRSVTGGVIVETEAYIGEDDPACHAHRGQTPRNSVMYGPPGHAYVYFTYGNHWMLNFVTERDGFPAAVLIRGLEPTLGLDAIRRRRANVRREYDLTNGPGKLTAALGISGADNGLPLYGPRFALSRAALKGLTLSSSGRVGINAGNDRPWRFFVEDNPFVSIYRRGGKRGSVTPAA